jgi:hypothetical protein
VVCEKLVLVAPGRVRLKMGLELLFRMRLYEIFAVHWLTEVRIDSSPKQAPCPCNVIPLTLGLVVTIYPFPGEPSIPNFIEAKTSTRLNVEDRDGCNSKTRRSHRGYVSDHIPFFR